MKKTVLFAAGLALALSSGASAQEPCDNCTNGCPLGHEGLWITSSGTGDDILSFGFGENKCLYDEPSLCDELIGCDPSLQLGNVLLALASLSTEGQIIDHLKRINADFKLLKGRNAITLYGCGGTIAAVVPTTAHITRSVEFRPRFAVRVATAVSHAVN
jgi:hypothetical protein